MKITALEIAQVTGGKLTGPDDTSVSEIITDSRISVPAIGSVFFAVKGINHDGHNFIHQLYNRGVRVFVVEEPSSVLENLDDASFIVTGNSVKALQKVASFCRNQFSGTVIGITGSAGKTIVKEWLSGIISREQPVVRSPKSYNSQIGVPLSVWKINNNFRYAVIEAGISRPGEMGSLEEVIRPEIGIITNIGDAHSENFNDLTSKAREKLLLFTSCKVLIWCSDHKIIDSLIRTEGFSGNKTLVDWSLHDKSATVFAQLQPAGESCTGAKVTYNGATHSYNIPFTDRASVENALTVITASYAVGLNFETIRLGIEQLVPVAMRMELKAGVNDCQLIEDYYNSDPGSLAMALDYLHSRSGKKTCLILSDFLESGRDKKQLYSEVARLVNEMGIDRFIGIGGALTEYRSLFKTGGKFYLSTDDFIAGFNTDEFAGEVILLKGARVFEFEKISSLLEQKVHQTVLEINLDAVSDNISGFRKLINPGTKIMAMVKAFAYGTGPSEIASLLEYHRIDYLAVAYADEGVELRKAGISLPVVVMNPEASAFGVMFGNNLEPEIYSLKLLKQFSEAASKYGLSDYPVHIKLDTGMHRLGFMPGETDELARMLKSTPSVRTVSVFTHLAASENEHLDSFTVRQAELFTSIAGKLRSALGYDFMMHMLNSAGILRFPQYQFNMVRPGIGLYGIGFPAGSGFRPAARYITRISQVKKVPAGEPVGYGCLDVSDRDRLIAILPVGYADGLDRRLGNRNGSLFIRGTRAPFTGNICMDMCMADITGINAEEGDEAEIFGLNITIEEVAEKCGTIPYEILTSVPPRVKRVFHRG